AILADLAMQSLGLAAIVLFLPLAAWGWHLALRTVPERRRARLLIWPLAVLLLAAALSALPQPKSWPLPNGLGGILGDLFMTGALFIGVLPAAAASFVAGLLFLNTGAKIKRGFWWRKADGETEEAPELENERKAMVEEAEPDPDGRIEPTFDLEPFELDEEEEDEEGDEDEDITEPNYRITRSSEKKHTGLRRTQRSDTPYEAPPLKLLQQQPRSNKSRIS